MNKWIAEFELEEGDTMPELMDLCYKGAHIDFHCRPMWIPVSERLPEEGVDVLACFYTGKKNYKMMVSRRSDYNYWNGVGRTSDMVAWMPLPEPYFPEINVGKMAESEDR